MSDPNISRFWAVFIEKLKPYQVKPNHARWHVRHAEEYVKAYPDQGLATHAPQILEQYLQEKGRNSRLETGNTNSWLLH